MTPTLLRTVLTLANLTCAEAPLPAADLPAWVDARVKELQPAADEKRFDEIGWSTSILQAEKLARERSRPIFWFTHDGRMNVGRC